MCHRHSSVLCGLSLEQGTQSTRRTRRPSITGVGPTEGRGKGGIRGGKCTAGRRAQRKEKSTKTTENTKEKKNRRENVGVRRVRASRQTCARARHDFGIQKHKGTGPRPHKSFYKVLSLPMCFSWHVFLLFFSFLFSPLFSFGRRSSSSSGTRKTRKGSNTSSSLLARNRYEAVPGSKVRQHKTLAATASITNRFTLERRKQEPIKSQSLSLMSLFSSRKSGARLLQKQTDKPVKSTVVCKMN